MAAGRWRRTGCRWNVSSPPVRRRTRRHICAWTRAPRAPKRSPSSSSTACRRPEANVRYLVLSDIHANLEALDTVLGAELPDSYDRVLVLGDLVGYGADPNAVVDRIRTLDPLAV